MAEPLLLDECASCGQLRHVDPSTRVCLSCEFSPKAHRAMMAGADPPRKRGRKPHPDEYGECLNCLQVRRLKPAGQMPPHFTRRGGERCPAPPHAYSPVEAPEPSK